MDSSQRTHLVLLNIHCPSCVASITQILQSVSALISKIDVSILGGTVSFDRPASVPLDSICDELHAGGFEIADDSHPSHQSSLDWLAWIQAIKQRLQPGSPERKVQRARHRETCKACQADSAHVPKKVAPAEARAPHPHAALAKTRLLLTGMTCSSCVNSVKDKLQSLPGVQAADVVLLPPSATIQHDPDTITAHGLVDEIEDLGYGAELVASDALALVVATETPRPKGFKVTLSVGGMTCSSCVSSVSDAVKAIDGVQAFSVDLMNGSASLVLARQEDAERVANEIEDRGFECAVVDITDAAQRESKDERTRTVQIRVDGMFCHLCITKVNTCLSTLPEVLSYTPIVSVDNPVSKITYLPSPPRFTLRSIKEAIARLGGFQMSVQHDLTLAQRAERAQALERRRILVRLVITFLFVVPTFVVGVVGMMLLPMDNSFRHSLERRVWGHSTKGTWIMFALATPVQFGMGWFFYSRAYKSLRGVWRRKRQLPRSRVWFERLLKWGSMDTLVALGTTVGYAASLAYLALDVQGHGTGMENGSYFDVSVFLIFFILCGRYLESVSKTRTGDALRELAKTKPSKGLLYIPSDVEKRSSTSTQEVEADLIEQGDLILVQVGASPPVDAALLDISGECSFNEASMTGETKPVLKGPGDEIYAGTINAGPSSCLAKVTREPGSTVLDNIMASVKEAMSKKADIERVADAVTAYFVPAITAISIFTFVVWVVRGTAGNLPSDWLPSAGGAGAWVLFAVQFAVAVLVVACPCGIGLAAPTANLIGLGLAAQNGIMPQGGGQSFQAFSDIDHIVLDKTGTLTEGRFTVSDLLFFLDQQDHAEAVSIFLWTLIQVVEQVSSHPIAEGVSAWCADKLEEASMALPFQLDLVSADEVAGQGLSAEVAVGDARLSVHIGNHKMMSLLGAAYASAEAADLVAEKVQQWQAQGQSNIQIAVKMSSTSRLVPRELAGLSTERHEIVGVLAIQDPPRPEAKHVVSFLQKAGIHVWLVSGDNKATARAVGEQVGLSPDHIVAEALPAEKKKFVEDLQAGTTRRSGRKGILSVFRGTPRPLVAFCGDGINDAAAIAASDVGIAMGSGSSVALTSADFCLLNSSLLGLISLQNISWLTIRKVLTNFIWAGLYNIILIPLAAGAFYPLGQTRLPPVWAALAMALSSVSVVLNSLLLRWTYRQPKAVRNFRSESVLEPNV